MSEAIKFSSTLVALTLASVFSHAGETLKPPKPSAPGVSVSADGSDLLIKRSSDTAPVRVPVLDRCGNPAVGEARIRNIEKTRSEVIASYGKHCWASLSLKDLVLECSGCD